MASSHAVSRLDNDNGAAGSRALSRPKRRFTRFSVGYGTRGNDLMISSKWRIRWMVSIAAALLVVGTIPSAATQEFTLHLDPGQSNAAFTLGGTGHTVHGTFNLKNGEIHFDPASGKASGEIVFDATSGQTGNQSRDHK